MSRRNDVFSSLDRADIVLKPGADGRQQYVQTDHRTAEEVEQGELPPGAEAKDWRLLVDSTARRHAKAAALA
jgi:hypothetical protein